MRSGESTFRIEGLDPLIAKLKTLEPRLAKKVIAGALRDGAKIVASEAKSIVPKASGQLARSIRVRAGKRKKGYLSVHAAADKKWFTGPAYYAGFIEFGFKKVPIRRLANGRIISLRRGSKPLTPQPARPFMQTAFERTQSRVKQSIVTAIQRGIEQIAGEKP